MPLAFAFELGDEESERDARTAHCLWYSNYPTAIQKKPYIAKAVLLGECEWK